MNIKDKIVNIFKNLKERYKKLFKERFTITKRLSYTNYVTVCRVLYNGSVDELMQIYKKLPNANKYFWARMNEDEHTLARTEHFGRDMVNKLKELVVNALDEIEIDNEKIQEIFNEFYETEQFYKGFEELVLEGVKVGQAVGTFVLVPNSKYPKIKIYSGDEYERIEEYGELKGFDFYDTFEKDVDEQGEAKNRYLLITHQRAGATTYNLYDEKGNEIPLSYLPETSNLTPIQWGYTQENKNEIGEIIETFENDIAFINGFEFKFRQSSEFKGKGASILEGRWEALDGLDMISSLWDTAAIDSAPITFMDKKLANSSEKGISKKFVLIGDDKSKFKAQGNENYNGITVSNQSFNSNDYQVTRAMAIQRCINGDFDGTTFGIDTRISQDANASYQENLQDTTLHTRNDAIYTLQDTLKNLTIIYLKLYSFLSGENINIEELDIDVIFNEFQKPSFEKISTTLNANVNAGWLSKHQALRMAFPDLDDEKIEELYQEKLKEDLDALRNVQENQMQPNNKDNFDDKDEKEDFKKKEKEEKKENEKDNEEVE